MASVFLPAGTGVARMVDTGKSAPVFKLLAIYDDDWKNFNPIVTDFKLNLNTNHQFMHALDSKIYLFPFGDRIGELVVTGIAFESGYCEGATIVTPKDSIRGPIHYYMTKKLNTKIGREGLNIVIGEYTQPLKGFLAGFNIGAETQTLPIVQWVMRFYVVMPAPSGGTP